MDNFSTLLEHMVVKVCAQNRNTDTPRLTMGYILLNPSYAENTVKSKENAFDTLNLSNSIAQPILP